jgi:ribonuclease Z
LYEEPAFTVSAAILDHSIPCLGLSIKERFHVNIFKTGLQTLGLEPGPWLAKFKQALYRQASPDAKFEVQFDPKENGRRFVLGELADKIARITPGQKISYITDVVDSEFNRKRIVEFVKDSDHLFIEAAFLDKHRDVAQRKSHLTARQAGLLAALARVKHFTVFHFSPRYTGQEQQLIEEASAAYEDAIK